MSSKTDRHAAAERYREAKDALDTFVERREDEKAAGRPVVTGDENDPEFGVGDDPCSR